LCVRTWPSAASRSYSATTVAAHVKRYFELKALMLATFGSTSIPGSIDMTRFGSSVLLASISTSRSPFVQTFTALHPDNTKFTDIELADKLQQWEQDQVLAKLDRAWLT
jgi:hypothetical protein